MTREELRILLIDEGPFCGCGEPEDACRELLHLLRLHPLFENRAEFDSYVQINGHRMLLLYLLDSMGLTEHGGSIGGAWLSPRGEAVRAALEAEEENGFEDLTESHCIHGYDMDDNEHDCMTADDPEPWKQKVYVLETGVYAERGVYGIFASPEEAMKAWPRGNWTQREEGYWANDLGMDLHADVTEYALEVEGKER